MRRLVVIALCAGCLEVPEAPGHECSVDTDCNTAAGEVCTEGLCYGNPPPGAFAAAISAPSTREDLISTEIPVLELPRNGNLGDLALEAPVTLSGRVEAYCPAGNQCTNDSIAAEIRITRASRFPGGPTLRLSTSSQAGIPRGTDSFSIRVPRTHEGDPPYVVTIDPEGGGEMPPSDGERDPAELVPPRRFAITATESSEHQTYTLGSATSQVITGQLKDPLGNYLTNYRVVAIGRFVGAVARTEVSTVAYTTDGQFALTLADDLEGPLEIVARSYDPMVVAPELRSPAASLSVQSKTLSQPVGLGDRIDVAIPIKGLSGDGQVKPVAGARVIVHGLHPSTFTGGTNAVFTAETITGDDGVAKLALLDGSTMASSYRLRVVPPAGSNLGVVFDAPVMLDYPDAVQLPLRVAIRGTVVDHSGKPLGDVSVSARRSLRFLWSLLPEDQAFLDEIPAATAITPESGDFVLWVDPTVSDAWGHYDVRFEAPAGSTAPNWLISELEIPRSPGTTTIPLETVTLPDAAYLRSRIVDPNGTPVDGCSLRIFALPADNLLCTEVGYAPEVCAVDAQVVGSGESDTAGIVRLDVPRL